MDTKKTWGNSRAYLHPRPSHCLCYKISNLASPRRRYYKHCMLPANLADKHTGIIHPRGRLVAKSSTVQKLRSFG